MDEFDLQMSHT